MMRVFTSLAVGTIISYGEPFVADILLTVLGCPPNATVCRNTIFISIQSIFRPNLTFGIDY